MALGIYCEMNSEEVNITSDHRSTRRPFGDYNVEVPFTGMVQVPLLSILTASDGMVEVLAPMLLAKEPMTVMQAIVNYLTPDNAREFGECIYGTPNNDTLKALVTKLQAILDENEEYARSQ